MAGIDKTYISSWKVFDKIRNWAKNQSFILKNNKRIYLIDYMYYPLLTKEEWDKWKKSYKKIYPNYKFELTLWNTPTYVDIWLIRNCPFEEIQNRLKEQYGGGWSKTAFTNHNDDDLYEQIKNGTSIYDTYQRNGLGKNAKVIFKNLYGNWIRDKKLYWSVSIESPNNYWYNENDNAWYSDKEAMPWTSNHYYHKGTLTRKNIVNLIKKWDLPKNTILEFNVTYDRHIVHEFLVITK